MAKTPVDLFAVEPEAAEAPPSTKTLSKDVATALTWLDASYDAGAYNSEAKRHEGQWRSLPVADKTQAEAVFAVLRRAASSTKDSDRTLGLDTKYGEKDGQGRAYFRARDVRQYTK